MKENNETWKDDEFLRSKVFDYEFPKAEIKGNEKTNIVDEVINSALNPHKIWTASEASMKASIRGNELWKGVYVDIEDKIHRAEFLTSLELPVCKQEITIRYLQKRGYMILRKKYNFLKEVIRSFKEYRYKRSPVEIDNFIIVWAGSDEFIKMFTWSGDEEKFREITSRDRVEGIMSYIYNKLSLDNSMLYSKVEKVISKHYEWIYPNKKEMTDDEFKEELGEIASKLNM
jgi:hypothetical protein